MKRQLFALLIGCALTPVGTAAQQPTIDAPSTDTAAALPALRPAAAVSVDGASIVGCCAAAPTGVSAQPMRRAKSCRFMVGSGDPS
jgi:hypothetical protein